VNTFINSIKHRYSKQGLWSLFLVCAFPLHLWALILIFRDMDWVIERTNVWDAIGVGSYGMVFALIETLVIFVVIALLGFFTPAQWDIDRRIAFLSLLIIITALWAMISQLRFLWNISLPFPVMQFIARSEHPFRLLYALSLAIVVPTILVPVYLFIRSNKSVKFVQELTERLSMLTLSYLLFDLLGVVIVIIRNLS
jgi:hypothetical protein